MTMAGWAELDYRPTTRDVSRDCVAPPLLAYVAQVAAEKARPSGWTRITADKAAPACGIKARTVRTELAQMAARGTIEFRNLGDGDYDVKLTDLGRSRLAVA